MNKSGKVTAGNTSKALPLISPVSVCNSKK